MKLFGHFNGKFGPRNKYGNKKISHAGYSFASKGEADLFDYLKLLEHQKELKDIQVQATVHLTEGRSQIRYIADFKVFSIKDNRDEWYEFKGFETPEWRLKRRLWMDFGPGPLKIYKKSGRIFLFDEIFPG